MLYSFIKLDLKLTELGYPQKSGQGFRVMKKDLTKEEKAGNLTYKEDGIYLTVDGASYKGYMYIKRADIGRYNLPKFHITDCETIKQQKAAGTFDDKYHWHNNNIVSIEDRVTGEVHENVNLELCYKCKLIAKTLALYNNTQGFFDILDKQELEDINEEVDVMFSGYTWDWDVISKAYRAEQDYCCERCRIKIEEPFDRRFIQVHHRSGKKIDNRRTNLESLCILCHAHVDVNHEVNFSKRKAKGMLASFIEKFREELIRLNNPHVHLYT